MPYLLPSRPEKKIQYNSHMWLFIFKFKLRKTEYFVPQSNEPYFQC